MTTNAVRAHLAEFGIVAGIGRNGLQALLGLIRKVERTEIPAEACLCLATLADQVDLLKQPKLEMDRRINSIVPMISAAGARRFECGHLTGI
ncbi:hypothetical protein [Rhizobium mongolense]|uniref:hypothetical protein n=1 Tax=Rhizobium mongolense TaxID=57676 RepID=UPI000B84257C|nr:hypothetical protein [Rhizobium mongolense]